MLLDVTRQYSVSVDGQGFFGRTSYVKLPDIKPMLDEYRGGGMDAPVPIDMGMEALKGSIRFGDMATDIMARFGIVSAAATRFTVRGALTNPLAPLVARPFVAIMAGVIGVSGPELEPGKRAELEIEISCSFYSFVCPPAPPITIDVLNGIRVSAGADQIAAYRALVGR